MKISFLQGVLVLVAIFAYASFAQASPGHHSHHKTKVVSPFDKVNSDKPLHCLLNSHLHQSNQDCPHKANHSTKNKSAKLSADCGSKTGNSEGISFGYDLPQFSQSDEFSHHLISQFLISQATCKIRSLPRSFEHPPQLS